MQHAQQYRLAWVVVEKPKQHFVADLGPEKEASLGTGVERGHARPDAVVAVVDQRQPHPHAELAVRVFVVGHHARLQACHRRQHRGRALRLQALAQRRVGRNAAELQMGFPAALGVEGLTHAGDEHVAAETLADAPELDGVAGQEGGDANAHRAAACQIDARTLHRGAGQCRGLGGIERAVVQQRFFAAGAGGQLVGVEIAGGREGGRLGVLHLKRLIGGAPADRLHRPGLQPRVDLGVELEQRRAEPQLGHRAVEDRRLDRQPGAARKNQPAVRCSPRDDEIPVAAVVLHQLLVRHRRGFDVGADVGRAEQRLDDVAVGLVEEVGAAPQQREAGRLMPALDDEQRRRGFAYPQALAHHDALENERRLTAAAGQHLDDGTGLEEVEVAEREVAVADRPLHVSQARRRDAVDRRQHAHRIQRVFARHRLAVDLDRELTMLGADGQGAFGRHGVAWRGYLRSGGKRTRVPAGRWRTPSSLLARATFRYSAGSP